VLISREMRPSGDQWISVRSLTRWRCRCRLTVPGHQEIERFGHCIYDGGLWLVISSAQPFLISI